MKSMAKEFNFKILREQHFNLGQNKKSKKIRINPNLFAQYGFFVIYQ